MLLGSGLKATAQILGQESPCWSVKDKYTSCIKPVCVA